MQHFTVALTFGAVLQTTDICTSSLLVEDSECKHPIVSLDLHVAYAHDGRPSTRKQSNIGDRMESESPTGNAATLLCYGITLFSLFARGT